MRCHHSTLFFSFHFHSTLEKGLAEEIPDLGSGSGCGFCNTEHETAVHIDDGLKNMDCLPTAIVTLAAHTWPVAAGVVADRLPRSSQAPTWQLS